jgi:hypothetical protein
MGFIASVNSVEVTEDGVVKAKGGQLVSVVLTAGADAASVILYNNASAASGTKVLTLKAAAASTVVFTPIAPIVFSAGLYADVSGTSPAVYVGYV